MKKKELKFFLYKYRKYLHFDLHIMTSFLISLYFNIELTKEHRAEIVKFT